MQTRTAAAIGGTLGFLGARCAPALAPRVPAVATAFRIPRRLPSEGIVALTFDDGPHPRGTPAVLEILRGHAASATFFLVGEQVRRTGGLIDEIRAAGHTVAVHGDTHRTLLRLPGRTLRDDLDRATDVLGAGTLPAHRAPYGAYTPQALAEVRRRGWSPLLWSRWGRDWRRRATPRGVAAEVTRDLAAGDVLLLHDADDYSVPGSWQTTAAALPQVLEAIAAAGLAARAITPEQVGSTAAHTSDSPPPSR